MLRGGRDDEAITKAAAAFGLAAQLEPEPAVDVWPDHWQAMEIYSAMSTQINISGVGSVIGYHYPSLPVVMDMHGIDAVDRRRVFEDFRVMEAEALKVFAERRNG